MSRSIVGALVACAVALAACGGGGAGPDGGGGGLGGGGGTGGDNPNFPVNEAAAAAIAAMGVPADGARFLAAARLELSSPDGKTYVFKQTFPNGAARMMTLAFTPDETYVPTAEESAAVTAGALPVYDKHYASASVMGGTIETYIRYFIPSAGLPADVVARFASSTPLAAADDDGLLPAGESGAGAAWGETAAAGADVGIGAVLDYASARGLPVGSLGAIYTIASALSSVASAADINREADPLFRELADLEHCARNPTNPVARSDPSYVTTAVGQVQSARSELQQVTGVRFLNVATQTLSGLTAASAVLGAALTSGFRWNEQTLHDYTYDTIMREARLAVVQCEDPGMLRGNVEVMTTCTTMSPSQTDNETSRTVSSVGWTWNAAILQYQPVGTFTHTYRHTSTSSTGSCTSSKDGTGDLTAMGGLSVFTDPAVISLLGYAYVGGGNADMHVTAVDCDGNTSAYEDSVAWLPTIMGLIGTGGVIEGTRSEPWCQGGGSGTSGTRTWTWSFSLPPMPMP